MPAMPTPDRPLRLGTRQSPLAMAQAEETRARLCAAHDWPQEAVKLVTVRASGDKIHDRALADIGGKALWTRELDIWLREGEIDAAVHSMKDVETQRPAELAIAAILPRADKADRILGAASIAQLRPGAVVGTSAPRRAAQLLNERSDCKVVTFRGNVATRMAKLAAGDVHATFLAAGGLERLGETGVGTRLDPSVWLPAPAQAAIGIECRADDEAARELFLAIDHAPSSAEVMAERALLAGLGGSCHSPVAVLSEPDVGGYTMRAAIFSSDGAVRIDGETRYESGVHDGVRALAARMLDDAPAIVRDLFTGHA